jgi:Taurine catabolism dioxygenase TauD, TfdA family
VKYGVLVFRDTGLDDTRHVEFSKRFGELDDIKPYLTNGRKAKFPYYELFDAGNLDDEGNPIALDSQRSHYNKVRITLPFPISTNKMCTCRGMVSGTSIPVSTPAVHPTPSSSRT